MNIPDNLVFIPAKEDIIRRTRIEALWNMGFYGQGSRVAIVDTGINVNDIEGKAPIFEHDYTGENNFDDCNKPHGTIVANCVRLIAPECELLNIKVIPQYSFTNKDNVAKVLRQLNIQNVDIINISLDFDSKGCDPHFKTKISDWHGAVLVSNILDKNSICDLCLACNELSVSGIPVIVAAGNRWGKRTNCPGRSPGTFCVTASMSKAENNYYFKSKSRFKIWWNWKFLGKIGRNFGTSFACGYSSGEFAVLLPWIRKVGWVEASKRISKIEYIGTTSAIQMHDSLVDNSIECQQVSAALEISFQNGNIAGALKTLDELNKVKPHDVTSSLRKQVMIYLKVISEQTIQMESGVQEIFERTGLSKLRTNWDVDN